jgi:hypothetical protein
MSQEIFMQDDRVYYTGNKERLKQALTKDGKPLVGWIYAPVSNEPGAFVVFFPETKEEDSYIISANNLSKYKPAQTEKQRGPEIQPRRKKRQDSE